MSLLFPSYNPFYMLSYEVLPVTPIIPVAPIVPVTQVEEVVPVTPVTTVIPVTTVTTVSSNNATVIQYNYNSTGLNSNIISTNSNATVNGTSFTTTANTTATVYVYLTAYNNINNTYTFTLALNSTLISSVSVTPQPTDRSSQTASVSLSPGTYNISITPPSQLPLGFNLTAYVVIQ